ncbi:signal peptidase I [Gordonia sp. OPL2]|uniref:signal peptidase I n=1 Tax=Gordonia sp. OPL2 TaxID=2486274 RepID=UPI001654C890|nr:signal peptidase I [Gordonia sp. OPL2]ROZ88938.1 signal peptidase I [Gordonia sp. OPL2]
MSELAARRHRRPDGESGRREVSGLVDAALWVGAVLGLVCVVAALSAVIVGLTPLVVRSGSMSPAMPTGSLAVAREVPATQVSAGDVVSVTADNGDRVTHRVEKVSSVTGNSVTLILKGDDNNVVDARPYVVTDVDRVVIAVPYAGYLVAALSTPTAAVAGAILAIWLVATVFWPVRRPRSRPRPRHSMSGVSNGVGILLVLVMICAAIGFGRPGPAFAAPLTDTASGRVTVSTGTVTRPASFTCANTGLQLTAQLSWPVVNPTYRYLVVYTGALLTTAVRQVVPAQASGTITVTPPAAIALLTVTASLHSLVGDNFVSSPPLTRTIIPVLGLSVCSPAGTTTNSLAPRRVSPSGSASSSVPSSTSPSSGSRSPAVSSTPAAPETTGPSSSPPITTSPTTPSPTTPPTTAPESAPAAPARDGPAPTSTPTTAAPPTAPPDSAPTSPSTSTTGTRTPAARADADDAASSSAVTTTTPPLPGA